jgi:cytochrome P450
VVLDESMRLYPPAWTTGREVEIAGYRIPAGSQLMLSQWLVHRDARFFPDPEAFDPDRWLPDLAARRIDAASSLRAAARPNSGARAVGPAPAKSPGLRVRVHLRSHTSAAFTRNTVA